MTADGLVRRSKPLSVKRGLGISKHDGEGRVLTVELAGTQTQWSDHVPASISMKITFLHALVLNLLQLCRRVRCCGCHHDRGS